MAITKQYIFFNKHKSYTYKIKNKSYYYIYIMHIYFVRIGTYYTYEGTVKTIEKPIVKY